jgi:hypothetical protein
MSPPHRYIRQPDDARSRSHGCARRSAPPPDGRDPRRHGRHADPAQRVPQRPAVLLNRSVLGPMRGGQETAAWALTLIRVARLGCRGTWELWTGLAGVLWGGSTPSALGSCAPGLRSHEARRGRSPGARIRVSWGRLPPAWGGTIPWRSSYPGGDTRSHWTLRSRLCLAGPGGHAAREGDPDEPILTPSGRTR